MTSPRRRVISTPGERRIADGRGPWTVGVSLAVHVVLVLVLIQVTIMPSEWFDVLNRAGSLPPVERVGFLQLPAGEPPLEAPRRGGDDRPAPALPRPPAIRPIAPVAVPSGLPAIPSRPPRTAEEIGTGPLVGGGGDTRGIRPSYADPRLWVRDAPTVTAPLQGTEKLDSAFAPIFRELSDSIRAAAASGRDPNDWTFRVGGQKFGVDQKFIRLGPVSIPTAALAFLPLNLPQGNPTSADRDRRLSQIRGEIMQQAMRAARDEDFRNAVKALRERKEKEREEKKKADRPPGTIIP
ncbi:MAG: hypothetical protein O2973_05990 [Gemmatimonadetes bacterium]|nr:hypothetical protein [Gemmatimonadota bacterium]